jgi:hypothetical protein
MKDWEMIFENLGGNFVIFVRLEEGGFLLLKRLKKDKMEKGIMN